MAKWQPIKTAPKEICVEILCMGTELQEPVDGLLGRRYMANHSNDEAVGSHAYPLAASPRFPFGDTDRWLKHLTPTKSSLTRTAR